MHDYSGKFISIEGNDGVGKSTQARILVTRLNNKHAMGCATLTKEPSDDLVGKQVRELICKHELLRDTQLLLIAAARAEHLDTIIKPKLQSGNIVVTDRFIHSSFAYQNPEKAQILHEHFADNIYPDLTLILDADIDTLRKRIHFRYPLTRHSVYDKAPDVEFKRRRKEFLEWIDNKKVFCIDATQDEHKVADDIWEHVSEHILKKIKKPQILQG